MKMKKELMKRVAAAGLAVSMVAGLTACGPTGKPEETKKEETKAEAERLPQLQIRKMLQLLTEKLLCVSAGGEAMPDIRQQRRHVRHLWKNILISR